MINCGLYIRVSSTEQAENGYSLGEQEERLKKYCEAMGWDVFKVYNDSGFSGANMNRPALQEMIRDIKKLDKIVVYKLDRLSRSQKDTLYLIEDIFLRNNCDFISMSESFDTNSPFGRATIGILGVFAQLEREQIRERMKMGKAARAKEGKFHGGCQAPIGYDYVDGELVTNESEKEQVQKIFTMYSEGYSPPAITKYLNENGYTTKYGKWLKNTVHDLLGKKTYLGYTMHKGEYFKGTHEAFISEELFDTVQRIRADRSIMNEKYQRREGRCKSYLGGLMVCAVCGNKFTKVTHYHRANEEPILYYGCRHRCRYHGPDKCTNKIWRMEELDDLIIGEIKKLKLEPVEIVPEEPKEDKRIEKIDKQISRLIDLYSLGSIPVEEIQSKITALNEKKQSVIESIEKEKEKAAGKLRQADAISLIDSLDAVLESKDYSCIKRVISALIEKIVIDHDNVSIYWRFE